MVLSLTEWYTWCRASQNSIHGAELKQNSVHGAELKQRRQENKMMNDEFYASYLTKKTMSKMTKDEFFASYLKKKPVPH